MTEATRAWIYRCTVALGAVGVAFGVITESKAGAISAFVLVAVSGLAAKNTSTSR